MFWRIYITDYCLLTHERTLDETLPKSGPDVVGRPGDILNRNQSWRSEGRLISMRHHDLTGPDTRPHHDVGELQQVEYVSLVRVCTGGVLPLAISI